MKEVTMIYADAVYAECPYCRAHLDGWVGDPRGCEPEKCDECGKEFTVSIHADVELR